MMNDQELKEYQELAAKAEAEQISYEELTRLNELHVVFLQFCYDSALKNAEEQQEIKESFELIQESLDENDSLNAVLIAFIEEKGLTDEFNEFFNTAIDEAIEEITGSNVVH